MLWPRSVQRSVRALGDGLRVVRASREKGDRRTWHGRNRRARASRDLRVTLTACMAASLPVNSVRAPATATIPVHGAHAGPQHAPRMTPPPSLTATTRSAHASEPRCTRSARKADTPGRVPPSPRAGKLRRVVVVAVADVVRDEVLERLEALEQLLRLDRLLRLVGADQPRGGLGGGLPADLLGLGGL